ncbi:hypothetical protein [Methanogenium sp. MK-MG]|uniref:hypothetical protein n=1 Tax=Methanogenium sp. MK-MG TaxID=2599926 RepID=UPI0013ED6963|nr:hypothetical protein [Methanogenium sp. MK-MG]
MPQGNQVNYPRLNKVVGFLPVLIANVFGIMIDGIRMPPLMQQDGSALPSGITPV